MARNDPSSKGLIGVKTIDFRKSNKSLVFLVQRLSVFSTKEAAVLSQQRVFGNRISKSFDQLLFHWCLHESQANELSLLPKGRKSACVFSRERGSMASRANQQGEFQSLPHPVTTVPNFPGREVKEVSLPMVPFGGVPTTIDEREFKMRAPFNWTHFCI